MHYKLTIFFFSLNFATEFIKGDPGRDQCKIVNGPGLKCSNMNSYYFPFDIFLSFNDDVAQFTTEMKYLEIKNSNITILQSKSFQRMPYLSHFILSNSFLIEIEPSAFEGLRRLKSVDLSSNFIQNIPVDAFQYSKLSSLILSSNPLLEIPTNGPILNAEFLTSLSLKECNIQHLPGSAFKKTLALIHLDLSRNLLKTLPVEVFSNLKHLNYIDLSGNQFNTLDIKTFESMPFFPNSPTSVILSNNPWICDCKIAKLGMWLTKNIKTGDWSDSAKLSRLKKIVECKQPKQMLWNSNSFKDLMNSC